MHRLCLVLAGLVLLSGPSLAEAGASKSKPANANAADTPAAQAVHRERENKAKAKGQHRGKPNSDASVDEDNKAGKNQGRGNERSQEMLARRDERKRIQGEYRADREPGQEADKPEGESGKKPWYKFWD